MLCLLIGAVLGFGLARICRHGKSAPLLGGAPKLALSICEDIGIKGGKVAFQPGQKVMAISLGGRVHFILLTTTGPSAISLN